MEYLHEKLKEYCESDAIAFHMPGHKRNPEFLSEFPEMRIDITEIDGFDNLHHAEEVILDLTNRISRLFGTKKSFLSVNGSTAGILSAISAVVKPGEKILIARNCHKAVYHSIYLRNLKPYYLYPKWDSKSGLNGGISAEDVDNILKNNRDIQAVVITSPTYDGMVSDVKAISDTVHRYQVPLIVDEAHGAHFIFSDVFPKSALQNGADIVIQSVHKTLPAMTQTAVLHLMSDIVKEEKIAQFMGIYQSSSPSYVLMSSVDYCIRVLEEKGPALFENYTKHLLDFRRQMKVLKHLWIVEYDRENPYDIYDLDLSKIIISTINCNLSGKELANILRQKYHLEMEMEAEQYCLALGSVGDTEEAFDRLKKALVEIDSVIEEQGKESEEECIEKEYPEKEYPGKEKMDIPNGCNMENTYCMSPFDALEAEQESIPIDSSEGYVSAEFAYLYPPGIPFLVPGEGISLQFVKTMRRCQEQGLKIQGLKDFSGNVIQVVKR